jgi:hypothetical protein
MAHNQRDKRRDRHFTDAPRKQRHTVTRIWHRLIDKHRMTDVSLSR